MQILESQSAVLTNGEVFNHLQDVHQRYMGYAEYDSKKADAKLKQVATVVQDAMKYLTNKDSPLNIESTTTTLASINEIEVDGKKVKLNPHYKDEAHIQKVLEELMPFGLTKSELVMLINIRPRSEVYADPIIEEQDIRFSEEQREQIVAIVEKHLGQDANQDAEVEEIKTAA